ncbi:TPA: hypothetical protein DCW54_00920 [Candidatus Dependentiae bacterium]|nr:hypothetical protein [Candidatus Dependentiae bacterium]
MEQRSTRRQSILYTLFCTAATLFWALIPHPWGATPLLGMTLASRRSASIVGSLSLLIPAIAHDLFFGFHATSIWVYASLFLIALLRTTSLFSSIKSVAAALAFFTITNFGVWYSTALYPLTWKGLVICYCAGLPYLSSLIASTLVTTYLCAFLQKRISYLTIKNAFSTLIQTWS